jgi:hypothetical protein
MFELAPFGFGLPVARRGHRWRGESGQWYDFAIYGIDEFFDFERVVYVIGRARSDGYFDPLYIGQSGEGDVRLSKHEKMPPARRLGATHVHVITVTERNFRFHIETDLRNSIVTPLNEQPSRAPLNSLAAALSGRTCLDEVFNPSPLSAFGSLSAALPTPASETKNHLIGLGALNYLSSEWKR